MSIPVFDGHNDFLLRLQKAPERRDEIWLKGDGTGHMDLPRLRDGHFVGGFFAIYIPSPHNDDDDDDFEAMMETPPYALPLPAMLDLGPSQAFAMSMAGHLMAMERAAPQDFRICRSGAEVTEAVAKGQIAAIMHMEGAEAIGPDLDALHVWHAAGLRSLGPVWSRPTVFGHGVPFRFPGAPDTGPGLTEAGQNLIRLCDRLGILVDLSHMNEKGFDDVARLSSRPLIATHSNAHAVTPSPRNLTDRQLDVIAESGGIVGLNFATIFLRDDGRRSPEMTLDPMLRHLDHLISRLGEGGVGLGSDFDGATVPMPIGDVAGVPALLQAMVAHGFGADLVARIAHRNWLDFLARNMD